MTSRRGAREDVATARRWRVVRDDLRSRAFHQ